MIKLVWGSLVSIGLLGCGAASSPEQEQAVIGTEYNMNLRTLFTCTAVISESSHETEFASLELSSPIKILYSVLFGTNTTNNEKIVKAEIDTAYNELGTSFDTSDFDVSKAEYYYDLGTTSPISLLKDLNDNNNGVWSFSNVDGQPAAVYTDSDLAASPVTINYVIDGTGAECYGSFGTDS